MRCLNLTKIASLCIAAAAPTAMGTAWANEYSCVHAAAANGYVNDNKFLWQVEQDCAVAYRIAYSDGVSTQPQAEAAVAAAEEYLRSLGYDAATVDQMDIAGHGA